MTGGNGTHGRRLHAARWSLNDQVMHRVMDERIVLLGQEVDDGLSNAIRSQACDVRLKPQALPHGPALRLMTARQCAPWTWRSRIISPPRSSAPA